jgi:hypothetical protein
MGDKDEITEEMIDAGVEALRPFLPPQESISQIYRMAAACLQAALAAQSSD